MRTEYEVPRMSFEKACRYGRVWVVLVWCGVCGEHAHPIMRGEGVKIYGFLNYFLLIFIKIDSPKIRQ